MTTFMALLYLLVLLPLGVLWSGFALSNLWAWFVVSTFGVPPLSIPAAIGLSLIISYLTRQKTSIDKSKETIELIIESVMWMAFRPAAALGIGWIVLQWI